jgi:hypothetical protein
MTKTPDPFLSEKDGSSTLVDDAAAAVRFAGLLPLRIAARFARHTVQVLFAIFVVILHPQFKWLAGLIAQSALVQRTVKPALQGFVTSVYNPYFAYLSRLAPLWAAVSIAVPLAVLEPAKFYATLLIAERPKAGIVLWLVLQGVSLILIDKTWTAVRPQSRKLWLVSRIHAWGWLNMEYGKHWIRRSVPFRSARIWKRQAERAARSLWRRIRGRLGEPSLRE